MEENVMVSLASQVAPAEEFGLSVFARVDQSTLESLDRCADEAGMPRSWLISRILQDWAGHQSDSTSDTVDLDQKVF
jgi:hypothetical protein